MKKTTAEIDKDDVILIDGEPFLVTQKPKFDVSVGMYLLVTDVVPEGDYFYPTDGWEVSNFDRIDELTSDPVVRDTSFAAHCEGGK